MPYGDIYLHQQWLSMACCLMAPSHYRCPNQCWPVIDGDQWDCGIHFQSVWGEAWPSLGTHTLKQFRIQILYCISEIVLVLSWSSWSVNAWWLCDAKWCHGSWSTRDQSRYVPSQWETSLHCNDVSHWLGAYLEWPYIGLRHGFSSGSNKSPPESVVTSQMDSKRTNFSEILIEIEVIQSFNLMHLQQSCLQNVCHFVWTALY